MLVSFVSCSHWKLHIQSKVRTTDLANYRIQRSWRSLTVINMSSNVHQIKRSSFFFFVSDVTSLYRNSTVSHVTGIQVTWEVAVWRGTWFKFHTWGLSLTCPRDDTCILSATGVLNCSPTLSVTPKLIYSLVHVLYVARDVVMEWRACSEISIYTVQDT